VLNGMAMNQEPGLRRSAQQSGLRVRRPPGSWRSCSQPVPAEITEARARDGDGDGDMGHSPARRLFGLGGRYRALAGQSGLPGLYPVFAPEQNELMRVVVTQIEWDGAMQRRMVDTAHCSDGPQWEDPAARPGGPGTVSPRSRHPRLPRRPG
jgi:hypothetical protein